MKRILTLLLSLLTVLVLSACKESTTLEDLGLNGLTGKEILTGIADGSINVDGYAVSVYDDELLVIVGDEKLSVKMPDDEFYVSVAPYIINTHECLYHSATGCRGEMKSESFYVEFIDNSGTVLLSQAMDSLSNGFIDLWLPRDVEGTLTITFEDMTVTKELSTTAGQPTCETTMKLQ